MLSGRLRPGSAIGPVQLPHFALDVPFVAIDTLELLSQLDSFRQGLRVENGVANADTNRVRPSSSIKVQRGAFPGTGRNAGMRLQKVYFVTQYIDGFVQ